MHGGYGSEFEDDRGTKRKSSWKDDRDLVDQRRNVCHSSKLPEKSLFADEYERAERKNDMFHFLAMNAYQRHTKLVEDYFRYYGGKREDFRRNADGDRTDFDVIKQHHKFLWDEDDADDTWGKRLAKKYYDKLFKEYCISDLSRYKENKFAMRWRTEKEVVDGKGQFLCGAKKCEEKEGLRTWEVNFAYGEHGEKKNALVKLRLCADCSYKLNYHSKRKEVKRKKNGKAARKATRLSANDDEKVGSCTLETSVDEGASSRSPTEYRSKRRLASDDKQHSDSAQQVESENSENPWKKSAPVFVDKTREDEFEEYLEDLFM